jgi:hypothetical protein
VVTWFCLLLCGLWSSELPAQNVPDWSVSAGPAFVFRTVQSSSPGLMLRATRLIKLSNTVYSELGLSWHGYLSSDWASRGEDPAPCPPGGCFTQAARDAISILGLEVGASYREESAKNPIFPVAGAGLYRVSAEDTTGAHAGINLGIVIPFRRSTVAPALEIRYFRVFGHSQFESVLPIILRWAF